MNSDTDPNASTPHQANDNPIDGPATARVLVEKLRELAGLEDRNMERCAGPIRAWSGEAADIIERLGQRASDFKKVGNPDLLAAPIHENVTCEAREVARKFSGYDDEKDIQYWGPASAHHDVERLAKALEAFRLAHSAAPQGEEGAYRARMLGHGVCKGFEAVVDDASGWPIAHCARLIDAEMIAKSLAALAPAAIASVREGAG